MKFNHHALNAALGLAVALGSVGVVHDAYAVSTSASASATVVTAITLTKAIDLSFGSFSTNAPNQTVTITTNGVRSVSGAQAIGNSGFGAARFEVGGGSTLTFLLLWRGNE